MSGFIGWVKKTARATSYLFNDKNHVESYMLESTCNDRRLPSRTELMTAARLSYEEIPYQFMRDVLLARLRQIRKPHSVRKAIILLDYAVRYGHTVVRGDVLKSQSVIEPLSIEESCPVVRMLTESRILAQALIVLVNSDSMYNAVREANAEEIEKIERLPIKLNGVLAKTVQGVEGSGTRRLSSPNKVPARIGGGFPAWRGTGQEDLPSLEVPLADLDGEDDVPPPLLNGKTAIGMFN
jgi:hypothetical protein